LLVFARWIEELETNLISRLVIELGTPSNNGADSQRSIECNFLRTGSTDVQHYAQTARHIHAAAQTQAALAYVYDRQAGLRIALRKPPLTRVIGMRLDARIEMNRMALK
jgi:hypothetical protein